MDCKTCHIKLSTDNCYKSDFERKSRICKSCRANKLKNTDKSKTKKYTKNKILKLKKLILSKYGNACSCCGIDVWQFLTVDHIDRSGAIHRKNINQKGAGHIFYQWLKNNDFPQNEFRILCMNCNVSVGFHGFCPHELRSQENKCGSCDKQLIDNQFQFHIKSKINICKACVLDKAIKNKSGKEDEKIHGRTLAQKRQYSKTSNLNLRESLLTGYGGKCNCCKESCYMFLTIDHVFNDGVSERKKYSNVNVEYRNLVKTGFPKDRYQILCANCNMAKQAYGICYHQSRVTHDNE